MIGGDDHTRVWQQTCSAKTGDELSNRGIRVGDLSIVGLALVFCPVGRGSFVGIVRVIQVYPYEERPLAVPLAGDPVDSPLHHQARPTLHGLIPVVALPAATETGVVHIKAAV